MFKAFVLSAHVAAAISTNYFIYTLKKLPWLGKRVPDSFYRIPTIKLLLSILTELFRFFFGFLGAALTLGLLVFGPIFVMEHDFTNMNLFYHYFFFIFFLVIPLGSNVIFQTQDIIAYTMVRILNLDKRDYLLSRVLYMLGVKAFRFAILLLFIGFFLKIDPLESLMLAGYILFAALIWEYLILEIFKITGANIYDRTGYIFLTLFLLLAICYLLPYWSITLAVRPALNSGFLFLLIALLAAFSFWRLYRHECYHALVKKTISRERLLGMAELLKNVAFADVNLAEDKLWQEKVDCTDHLEGYDLFNHLFFARHKGIIIKPVRAKVAIIAVIAVLFWAFLLFKPQFQDPVRENILSFSPYLVFIMFMLSSGERTTRALFFNCDRYMLKEHYYKKKKALLDSFTFRLKRSITLNLLPAAAVAALLLGTGAVIGMGGEIIRLLPVVVTVFSLSLFFSTHYLFIYYLLQPYTADLTKKRPLYSMVNALIYLICYGSIQIKTSSIYFTLAVIFFTLAYTGIALIMTYHLAPRTFKLR